MPKEQEAPNFYMASYLLDVMCARNVFAGMNLSWHVTELPVHFYFSVLWENWYKKECPRLSVASKKMISKVGH
jgi:hypothetical protein